MSRNSSLFNDVMQDTIISDSYTSYSTNTLFLPSSTTVPPSYLQSGKISSVNSKSPQSSSSSSSSSSVEFVPPIQSSIPNNKPKAFSEFACYVRKHPFNPIMRWSVSRGAVNCVSISPNPSVPLMAFCTDDGYIGLFDMKTNQFASLYHSSSVLLLLIPITSLRYTYVFRTRSGPAFTCAFSTDARLLAVCYFISLRSFTSLLLLPLCFHINT